MMKQRATTTEKALKLAEQKASELQGRLGETELKLAETTSILFTWDKEFADLKGGEKAQKQTCYNKGFRDAENSAGPVIFQAQKLDFMEGWMAEVNTIGLPGDSPFRNADRVPLPEDPRYSSDE